MENFEFFVMENGLTPGLITSMWTSLELPENLRNFALTLTEGSLTPLLETIDPETFDYFNLKNLMKLKALDVNLKNESGVNLKVVSFLQNMLN